MLKKPENTETVIGYDEDGMPIGMPHVNLTLIVVADPDDKAFLERAQGLISDLDSMLIPDVVSGRRRIVITKIERFPTLASSDISCHRMDCVHHCIPALGLQCEKARLVIDEAALCGSYQKKEGN